MQTGNDTSEINIPEVSCLMVTADRPRLMKRALHGYLNQTHDNKQIVIIDDGATDLEDPLSMIPADELTYRKLDSTANYTLGALRNLSLKEASGDYLVQWDDDDWYHPERIKRQLTTLTEGNHDACCVSASLMHLNTPPYDAHPYIGVLPEGIPGSIMHKNGFDIRYPETRRSEDTVYLKEWMHNSYAKLPEDEYHLFIRCYHGNNTWEEEHFLRRIRNSPVNLVSYLWYKYIRGDLFKHPKFQLHEEAQRAFEMFIQDSKTFGLL